jgi:hypothetical protein
VVSYLLHMIVDFKGEMDCESCRFSEINEIDEEWCSITGKMLWALDTDDGVLRRVYEGDRAAWCPLVPLVVAGGGDCECYRVSCARCLAKETEHRSLRCCDNCKHYAPTDVDCGDCGMECEGYDKWEAS